MQNARKLLAGILVAGLALTALGSPATAGADLRAPLNIRIATFDGNPKIKVKRKLSFLVSCSKNCGATISIKLITPAVVTPGKLSGGLAANKPQTANFRLTNYGLRYLRKNFRKSRLSVKVTAKDAETGKKYVKRKVFRFRLR